LAFKSIRQPSFREDSVQEMAMQIVHGDEVPVVTNVGEGVRSGAVGKQMLLLGDPASPGNFKFGLFHQYGDFESPRHRHNFCQWRVQLEGECDFDHDGKMKPGMIGYFPEGTHYGPQGPDMDPSYVATLQFGGPSGSGLLTPRQLVDAKRELSKIGVFEQGVFRRNPDVPGKKNMDGFEAVWEQASGRKLEYAPAQYSRPVLMNPSGYRWMPVAGLEGVEEKALGTFSDCRIPCASYRLQPGALFIAAGRGIYLVLSGRGSVEGQTFRRFTSVYLDTGETIRFRAVETSEMLLLGMPDVARMAQSVPADQASTAAA
jgi:hypothetical protein